MVFIGGGCLHIYKPLYLNDEKYSDLIYVSDAPDFKSHEVPHDVLMRITACWQLEYFSFDFLLIKNNNKKKTK